MWGSGHTRYCYSHLSLEPKHNVQYIIIRKHVSKIPSPQTSISVTVVLNSHAPPKGIIQKQEHSGIEDSHTALLNEAKYKHLQLQAWVFALQMSKTGCELPGHTLSCTQKTLTQLTTGSWQYVPVQDTRTLGAREKRPVENKLCGEDFIKTVYCNAERLRSN